MGYLLQRTKEEEIMAEDAGSIYSEVRINLNKLNGDIAKLDVKMNAIRKGQEKTATATKKAWTGSFSAIKIGGVAAMTAITMAMKTAISTGAKFEQSIANVASVANATAKEMKELSDAAKEAGATTRFTASQAADAMYSLSSAGFNTKQVMDSLNGVLLLAGATQSNLASTSETVVTTLKQFGLQASDSAKVANVFAAAASNSMANVTRLTASMTQAGAISGVMNISLEDSVAALEALYDAGVPAEKAGRAMKLIMLDLADANSTVTQKLEGMGFAYEDLDPTMNSFADIIDTLNSNSQRSIDIASAFGTVASGSVASLLKTGGNAIRDYRDEITDTNKAAEMYARQNNTLAGSFDLLKSAAENLAIGITEGFTPAFEPLVDLFASLLRTLGEMPVFFKVLFAGMIVGVPVVTALAGAVGALGGAAGITAAALGLIFSPIGAAVAGVSALAGVIAAIKSNIDRIDTKKLTPIAKELGTTVEHLKQIKKYFPDATNTKTMADILDKLGLTNKQLKILSQYTKANWFEHGTDWLDDGIAKAKELGISEKGYLTLVKEGNKDLTASQTKYINSKLDGIAKEEDAQAEADKKKADAAAKAKAEEEAVAQRAKERKAAYDSFSSAMTTYSKSLDDINKRQKNGILTDDEATQARLDADNTLYNSLENVDKKYVDTTKMQELAAKGIKALTGVIEDNAQALKDSEALQKLYTDNLQTIQSLTASMTSSNAELGKSTYQLNEMQRNNNLAIAKGLKLDESTEEAREKAIGIRKAATDAINTYFDALEEGQQQADIDGWNAKIASVGASEKELRDIERTNAIAREQSSGKSADDIKNAINLINQYYDALDNADGQKAIDDNAKSIEEWNLKTEKLGATTEELQDIEEREALSAVGLTDKKRQAIIAYYDKLRSLRDEADTEQEHDFDSYNTWNTKIQKIGASTEELRMIEELEAINSERNSGKKQEDIDATISLIKQYYDMLNQQDETDAFNDAFDTQQKDLQAWQDKIDHLDDYKKTEEELLQQEEVNAMAEAMMSGKSQDYIDAEIEKISEYYEGLKKVNKEKANDEILSNQEDELKAIQDKIQAIKDEGKSTVELQKEQNEQAIAALKNTRANIRAKSNLTDADKEQLKNIGNLIKGYEKMNDMLEDTSGADTFEYIMKHAFDSVADGILAIETALSTLDTTMSSINNAISNMAKNSVASLEAEKDALLESKGLADETDLESAQDDYDDEADAQQVVIDKYNEQIKLAKESGDASTAAAMESAKASYIAANADTLATYQNAVDKAQIEQDYADKESEIQYEANMKEYEWNMLNATATAALAVLKTMSKTAYPWNIPLGIAQTAAGAAQIASVAATKPKLATGGIILPQSGGVETIQAENGSPELSLNAGASGDALMGMFADKIVNKMNNGSSNIKSNIVVQLVMDRKVISTAVVDDINNGKVRLK